MNALGRRDAVAGDKRGRGQNPDGMRSREQTPDKAGAEPQGRKVTTLPVCAVCANLRANRRKRLARSRPLLTTPRAGSARTPM